MKHANFIVSYLSGGLVPFHVHLPSDLKSLELVG